MKNKMPGAYLCHFIPESLMDVFKITRRKYSQDLSGIGAGLYGGRWNPKGTNLVYTGGSISLACMEYLVHNIHVMGSNDLCLCKINIPESVYIEEVNQKTLPNGWNEKSFMPLFTQEIGQKFCRDRVNYVLKVPSAIIPDEFNYLLNPLHPFHRKTKITVQIDPFAMDERLFG